MFSTLLRRFRTRWWMSRGIVRPAIPNIPVRPRFRVETPLEVSKILDIDEEAEVLGCFLENLRPGDCVYDIGANIGLYAVPAALCVRPEGRVEAFEPVPLWEQRLEENVALNGLDNVDCHAVAFGAEEGTAVLTLKAEQGSGMASLQNGYGDAIDPALIETVSCPLVRGDGYAEANSLPPPDVIKLDVEGAELDVLVGLGGLLDHCRFLLCEVHPRFLPCPPEEVSDLLRERGFSIEALDRRRAEFHVLASR